MEIDLTFGTAGSSGQLLQANASGSWSGMVTFNFIGVPLRKATLSAQCVDQQGFAVVPYAQYATHVTTITNG